MTTPVRILLADDHTLVRAGLRNLINNLPGAEVVGEAASGPDAIALAHTLAPDILLMDLTMPGGGGLDTTRRLRSELPAVRVIILSMHATGDYVEQAIRCGAAGYVVKDAAPLELQLALDTVAHGRTWISPAVSRLVIRRHLDGDKPEAEALTKRQLEILKLIAEGLATKEIAFRLGLSTKTVETHRAQVMERLDIHDVAGLVRYALRTGLIANP